MKVVLAVEHLSLVQLSRTIGHVTTELDAQTFVALEIAKFVEVHDSVQQLELGIEDLVRGQLTPKIKP